MTKAETAIDQVRTEHFDALFIPVFAICHGPQFLIIARVFKGPKMTAWKTIQDDLQLVGANVVDQESLKLMEKVPVASR